MDDFRQTLIQKFNEKRSQETFYSLRDFARDLDLSPNHLSNVIKSKRGISGEMAKKLGLRLGLGPGLARFRFDAIARCARSKGARNMAKQALRRLR